MTSLYARLCVSLLIILVAVNFRTSRTPAQQPRPQQPSTQSQCPNVSVSGPYVDVKEGAEAMFSVNVSGGDPNVIPTYNWTVSDGMISSGQGTPTIKVETVKAGQTITATVDVGGYARDCNTTHSYTISIVKKGPPAIKFGEYATPDLSANKAQLDKFVRALEQDPSAQGYLIAYGGRTSQPGDAQKAADNATDYTMNVRKMDGERTLTGVGGYREQPTIELWIAPADGEPPMATPTVDPKDVKPTTSDKSSSTPKPKG